VDETVVVVGLDGAGALVLLGLSPGADVVDGAWVVGAWVVLGPGSAVVTISLRRVRAGLERYRAPWPGGR
jgi:hypothetical protein